MSDHRERPKPYTLNHWVVGSIPTRCTKPLIPGSYHLVQEKLSVFWRTSAGLQTDCMNGILLSSQMKRLTAVFEQCDEGGFHAFIPEIPGVHSQGETLEEAKANLLDALQELLSYRLEQSLKGKGSSRRLEAELVS